MNTKFDDFLQEQLLDPEFKSEYEALQPEHAVIQAMLSLVAEMEGGSPSSPLPFPPPKDREVMVLLHSV